MDCSATVVGPSVGPSVGRLVDGDTEGGKVLGDVVCGVAEGNPDGSAVGVAVGDCDCSLMGASPASQHVCMHRARRTSMLHLLASLNITQSSVGTKSTTPSHSGARVVGDGAPLGSGVGALEGTELPGAKDGVADGRAVAVLGGDAAGASVRSATLSGLTVGTAVGVDDGVKLTSGAAHPAHVLTQRTRIDGIEQPPCS